MHRVIAKFVLLSLLLSNFAPAMVAVSTTMPHACCMRKMHTRSTHEAAFQAASCCQHDCCNSLARSHFAHTPPAIARFRHSEQRRRSEVIQRFVVTAVDTFHSGRAPPSFS
jgi:hypothetical protein